MKFSNDNFSKLLTSDDFQKRTARILTELKNLKKNMQETHKSFHPNDSVELCKYRKIYPNNTPTSLFID